jgi:enoyl-CoA hydratase/carnithine racemase
MCGSTVQVDDSGIALITLNRPDKLNATTLTKRDLIGDRRLPRIDQRAAIAASDTSLLLARRRPRPRFR